VVTPAVRPEPRPPVDARPRRLSVTQVETWMRDPYGIYAQHILKLKALDELDADPGAAERGSFIHEALEKFVKKHPKDLPADAYEKLLAEGQVAFGEALARPGVRAFWWPRFQRIAEWFLEQEAERRATIQTLATEVKGSMTLPGKEKPFTLIAYADRIDRNADQQLEILDYKTGAPPDKRDLLSGYAPQLPLEAAMAQAGAFEGVPAGEVGLLSVWRLRGGEPAGEIRDLNVDPAEVAATARQGLQDLIAAFDDPATPYHARPKPEVAPRFSDYEHLARLKEWSAGGGEDGS
jgi:ATP-dependent helicase/nuclease subunit B